VTPACGGLVRDVHEPNETDTFLSVTTAVLLPTTTVLVRNSLGRGSWAQAQIVLDEEGRRELIELLGGTP
jgi:hypothetical protein